VTYGSFVVDIKDHKEEKEMTRLTVGGDQIEYPGDKSTRTAVSFPPQAANSLSLTSRIFI
jgi:hypothetical protein